ncbi:STAS domain-containing protein [Brucepastera parasyntrophica]|uniref:STAS domain-containing protein n=1 Tax=Brucepastera parasyntrophica TaxID=2880008 RepID=UPI00210AB08A|nr:STAS domain-containing protein [Brucepastera parasyntrophica]ULQ60889.1 STAS domain-containing protein [Brucepastera parasyntrophica]
MTNNEIVPGFDDEEDTSLKIRLEKVDTLPGCALIFLAGYIDTYNSAFFQARITKLIDSGFVRLIFNCSDLNYISSTGIGSFTTFLKTVRPDGGDIVLLEIQPKTYEVFQLLGFSQFFNTKQSMNEALDYFLETGGSDEDIFPKFFYCPSCSRKIKSTQSGKFRCSECEAVISIDTKGLISLG